MDAPAGTPVAVRQSDGTNAQTFDSQDYDSGVGTANRIGVGLIVAASGGPAVVTGDVTNGLDVDVTRLPALATGSNVIGALSANQSTNVAQINGVTPLMGAGNTGTGSLRVTVASDQAVIPISDNGGSLTVDGTVAVTLAAGAAAIAKAEDVASADADVGVPALAVRKATPANTSGTDGDYEFLQISAGRLWTSATVDAALPAGTNAIGKLAANSGVDIGDVDVTSIVPGTAATNLGKAEDAAHTTGDVGVMGLAVREGVPVDLSAGASNGDYEPLEVDAVGRLWTRTASQGTGTTVPTYSVHVPAANTQATISRAAGAAGVRNVCTSLSVVLAAGATAPTAAAVTVALIDGATGGTTYLWRHNITIPAIAGAMNGIAVTDCWFEGTAATAMTLELSAAAGANTLESVSMSTLTIAE